MPFMPQAYLCDYSDCMTYKTRYHVRILCPRVKIVLVFKTIYFFTLLVLFFTIEMNIFYPVLN